MLSALFIYVFYNNLVINTPFLYLVINTTFLFLVDLDFEYDENDVVPKKIVEKILSLPIADGIWPNCLTCLIRNAGKVNIDDFIAK